ncbi:MAG: hypothetical protein EAZ25_04910 [Oscillatoriales cyanobacterium]|nr:MAG: hypothetical protein EAZ86_21870 [Oscillatoriales cyanobacterium]TAG68184.1 MAG: hypothetical protein EAZ25_04910 [Oscillatoriales cyanobacterium]
MIGQYFIFSSLHYTAVLKKVRYALCPMPYALCPMPYALCPMPYALCPMPYRPRIFRSLHYILKNCDYSPPRRSFIECISMQANISVGAKHDRNQYGIITNNLYPVMLCPLQKPDAPTLLMAEDTFKKSKQPETKKLDQ